MENTKKINWFWKNWTEDEKRIYKKCAVFAAIVIVLEIIAAIMCMNQFHAAEIPTDWGIAPPGYHQETRWDDEKGEWYSVYVPDVEIEIGDFGLYKVDDSGALYIFKRIFNIIYTAVLPAASVMASTLIAYHICMIMTSKNQRKIDNSYTSVKSVATVWMYIMLTSVFITLAVQGFDSIVNSNFANPILKP